MAVRRRAEHLLLLAAVATGVALRLLRAALYGWVPEETDPWLNLWVLRYMGSHGLPSFFGLTRGNTATHVFWHPYGMDIAGFPPGIHILLYILHQPAELLGVPPAVTVSVFPVAMFVVCALGLYKLVSLYADPRRGILAVLALSLAYVSRLSLGFATRYTVGLALTPWLLYLAANLYRGRRYVVGFAAAAVLGLLSWRGSLAPLAVAVAVALLQRWYRLRWWLLATVAGGLAALGLAVVGGKGIALLVRSGGLHGTVAEYAPVVPPPMMYVALGAVALLAGYFVRRYLGGYVECPLAPALMLFASMGLLVTAVYFYDLFAVSLIAYLAVIRGRFSWLGLGAMMLFALALAPVNVLKPPLIMGQFTPSAVWLGALEFIESETPQDAVVVAWWDYGYWIVAGANRSTVADPSTINGTRIRLLAKALLSPPEEFGRYLERMGIKNESAYVLVYATVYADGCRVVLPVSNADGDIAKLPAIAKVAGADTAGAFICTPSGCVLNTSHPIANSTLVRLALYAAQTALGRHTEPVGGFELLRVFTSSAERNGYLYVVLLSIYRYVGG